MKNGYFKRAEEFFKRGKREYEEGFKENDTIKIQEGCEKVFHSLVELSKAILAEYGVPIPEDHIKRSELLQQFGLSWLYDSAKERLHNTCYYSGIVKKNYLNFVIDAIEQEIEKRR